MTPSSSERTLLILSDIHYVSEDEKAYGHASENVIGNPMGRWLAKVFHYFVWQRDFFAHNHWLDRFLDRAGNPDWVIALGDYSVGIRMLGISDPASFASARECLKKLQNRFGGRFRAVVGDHELGKRSLFGGSGGPRLASWRRIHADLKLEPFWTLDMGCYRLLAVVSTLVALPAFESDLLPDERDEWHRLREEHMSAIRHGLATLAPNQKVLLFCHDPTALPFLAREPAVNQHLDQIEQTIIGHLHTNLVFWKSRMLAGMPTIIGFGQGVRRVSEALHRAPAWRPFRVRLCPALAGIQLWRRSGYLEVRLDPAGQRPVRFFWRPLRVSW